MRSYVFSAVALAAAALASPATSAPQGGDGAARLVLANSYLEDRPLDYYNHYEYYQRHPGVIEPLYAPVDRTVRRKDRRRDRWDRRYRDRLERYEDRARRRYDWFD